MPRSTGSPRRATDGNLTRSGQTNGSHVGTPCSATYAQSTPQTKSSPTSPISPRTSERLAPHPVGPATHLATGEVEQPAGPLELGREDGQPAEDDQPARTGQRDQDDAADHDRRADDGDGHAVGQVQRAVPGEELAEGVPQRRPVVRPSGRVGSRDVRVRSRTSGILQPVRHCASSPTHSRPVTLYGLPRWSRSVRPGLRTAPRQGAEPDQHQGRSQVFIGDPPGSLRAVPKPPGTGQTARSRP